MTQEPAARCQAEAGMVSKAGCAEQAFTDAIAARFAFMQRLEQNVGFMTLSREMAAVHANKRLECGRADLCAAFRTSP